MLKVENVIVGAGPYGLSIASHLRGANVECLLIGRAMETWLNNMPAGMFLKSETFASNLSDPQRRYTFEHFYAARGVAYRPIGNPLSIADFVDYAQWFRQHAAPDVTDATLANLRRTENGFELALSDGSRIAARRAILATGYLAFQRMPAELEGLPAELVSHSAQHRDLARFAGRDVTVIGRGQSGLETAALLHEHGANVRLLARAASVEWNPDPNAPRSLLTRLRYPDAGLGAGWKSLAVSELPKAFFRLPLETRHRFVATSWGPSGAWWLEDRVVGKVPLLTSHTVARAVERAGRLAVTVRSGSEVKEIETDHVIAATGYAVDLARVAYLDPSLRREIATYQGSPILDTAFQSSAGGLHFVGISAAQSFGPVMRFVYGARHAATILARFLRTPARQRAAGLGIGVAAPAASG
jgi:cation diffusion facilitator CzcD-associated flavoprotein CzcO